LQIIKNMMKETDMQLEQEINDEIAVMHRNNESNEADNNEVRGLTDEDSSTQDTDFVDATKQVNNSLEMDNNSFVSAEVEDQSDEAIRKLNNDFLQQSWANIEANDEADQRLIQHLESEIPDNQGDFTLVTRPRGKAFKLKNPVNSNYATRNKTGARKPFR
jgi:hypothetical protein